MGSQKSHQAFPGLARGWKCLIELEFAIKYLLIRLCLAELQHHASS